MGEIGKMTFYSANYVPKLMGIWQFLFITFNSGIVATSSANLIKIGPVTPEITRVTTALLSTRRQESAYFTEYLDKYLTDFYQIFSVGKHILVLVHMWIIKLT